MKNFEGSRIYSRVLRSVRISCCALASILAACGGGGYGGGGSMPPPASVTISVAPASITLGQSAKVTWSANAACTASGDWSGSKAASGTETVTPAAAGTYTYKIKCSGGAYGGSTIESATLAVVAASGFSQTNLVSNGTAAARITDAKLINPWGLALSPTGPMWVANNGTQTSTIYDGTGVNQGLVVSIPVATSGPANPTGLVFNGSTDFVVTKASASAAALFIFSAEGGTISGWAPTVDPANAITMYDDGAGGAVYKGLAIANNGTANFLYATDFHNKKVDVFDAHFAKTTVSGGFTDSTLPSGYAPFGIQALQIAGSTAIVVTFAQQAANLHDNASGAGLGLVDIFDTSGKLLKHLVAAGGPLNAPWGIALAPADFGTMSNGLLIGNFGDGVINAFDAASGNLIGSVNDAAGKPLANPGLWGITFGNGANNQPAHTLYFAAGIAAETGGLYGRIDLGASPDTVPPTVALTTAAGTVSGTVSVAATASDDVGVTSVKFFAGTTLIGTATAAPFSVNWDTTKVANGSVVLTAQAADAAGNTTASAPVTVTVSNSAPAPVTLAQLQTTIFAPICSGCHNGSAAPPALPGSQNLSTATTSFAALVGVDSIEVPSLKRVKAGDPDNSYIIKKLEGTQSMGARMPLGGPYLDQPTIDKVRQWIQAGAAP